MGPLGVPLVLVHLSPGHFFFDLLHSQPAHTQLSVTPTDQPDLRSHFDGLHVPFLQLKPVEKR